MTGIDERLANWGRVMRRQRSHRQSLIFDGYWRAKSWDASGTSIPSRADPQDAWEIESAWSDRRLGPIAKTTLAYHYVFQLDPRKACRLIQDTYSVPLKPRLWDGYIAGAQVAIECVLELRERNKPTEIGQQSIDIPQVVGYKA